MSEQSATYQPGANYILPQDDVELQRLNEQQLFLRECVYDGRLVYDQNIQLIEGCWALDSGMGTGLWVTDLAKQCPESGQIHGIDISLEKVPSLTASQSNVHLSVASATDLPRHWVGKFDLINQCFLNGALLRDEWPKAISEFFRVLKPGGSIQLVEPNFNYPKNQGPAVQKNAARMEALYDRSRLMFHCGSELETMLKDTGFVDVVCETKVTPVGKVWGELGERGTRCYGGALRGMVRPMLKMGIVSSEAEYEKLMDDLESEWDSVGAEYVMCIACARKPR